jgi:hypothetical protein
MAEGGEDNVFCGTGSVTDEEQDCSRTSLRLLRAESAPESSFYNKKTRCSKRKLKLVKHRNVARDFLDTSAEELHLLLREEHTDNFFTHTDKVIFLEKMIREVQCETSQLAQLDREVRETMPAHLYPQWEIEEEENQVLCYHDLKVWLLRRCQEFLEESPKKDLANLQSYDWRETDATTSTPILGSGQGVGQNKGKLNYFFEDVTWR